MFDRLLMIGGVKSVTEFWTMTKGRGLTNKHKKGNNGVAVIRLHGGRIHISP